MAKTEKKKSILPFKIGAVLDIAGKCQKVVKRDGLCKLVIQPENAPDFIVFADFSEKSESIKRAKIRKSSSVRVKGKFQSFGASAVCLSDCRLQQLATLKKGDVLKLSKT